MTSKTDSTKGKQRYNCPNCDSQMRQSRKDPDYLHCGFCKDDFLKPEVTA